jgi:hypothetical protein
MGDCPYCEGIPYVTDPDETYSVCNAELGLQPRKHCPYAEEENWEDCPILRSEKHT